MSTTPDKLVERYLKHLEVELDDLPRDRRREIVDEIEGHIAEARAGLEHETEADVRNILEGLGDPADIAEDARERFEVRPPPAAQPFKPGWMEVAALILLLVGGLLIPIFGWIIGVVLLWFSNAWNVRDKIIGTVFVPGGLVLPIGLAVFSSGVSGGTCGPVISGSGRAITAAPCSYDATSTNVFGIVAVIALIVVPIVTTAYLAYRLRQQPSAAAIA
ncbi:MAG TPA: DUF1700 domain-containing protein [Gaiellaceae bacterium]|jgi:uncharacterized membrane protein